MRDARFDAIARQRIVVLEADRLVDDRWQALADAIDDLHTAIEARASAIHQLTWQIALFYEEEPCP